MNWRRRKRERRRRRRRRRRSRNSWSWKRNSCATRRWIMAHLFSSSSFFFSLLFSKCFDLFPAGVEPPQLPPFNEIDSLDLLIVLLLVLVLLFNTAATDNEFINISISPAQIHRLLSAMARSSDGIPAGGSHSLPPAGARWRWLCKSGSCVPIRVLHWQFWPPHACCCFTANRFSVAQVPFEME